MFAPPETVRDALDDSTDPTNAAMRAINERLGYEPRASGFIHRGPLASLGAVFPV